MTSRTIVCALVGLVLVVAPAAAIEQSAPVSTAAVELDAGPMMTPLCPEKVGTSAIEGWDPATCGACGTFCTSDNACMGRLLGDKCLNSGTNTDGTCKARTGCALYNCCYCG